MILTFTLQDKEGHGLIKLKDVEEYVYNDSVTLDIVTAERYIYDIIGYGLPCMLF